MDVRLCLRVQPPPRRLGYFTSSRYVMDVRLCLRVQPPPRRLGYFTSSRYVMDVLRYQSVQPGFVHSGIFGKFMLWIILILDPIMFMIVVIMQNGSTILLSSAFHVKTVLEVESVRTGMTTKLSTVIFVLLNPSQLLGNVCLAPKP